MSDVDAWAERLSLAVTYLLVGAVKRQATAWRWAFWG